MSQTMGLILGAYFALVVVLGIFNFFAVYHIWRYHFSKSHRRLIFFTVLFTLIFLLISLGPLLLIVDI